MLTDLTVKDFLNKVAGSDPVPGGGSIAALNGALASALAAMVANLTIGKKKYAEVQEDMQAIAQEAERLMGDFTADIADACVAMMSARNAVLAAVLNVRINLSSLKDAELAAHVRPQRRPRRRAERAHQPLLAEGRGTGDTPASRDRRTGTTGLPTRASTAEQGESPAPGLILHSSFLILH